MDKSDTPRCKEEVMPATGFPRPHRCHFKASKDGYCKIHHPDSVKAREEKQRLKYEAERAKSPYMLLQKANERNQQLEREVTALTAQLAEARRDADRLRERANNLFGALLEFHNAFHNRGETTSLHEWNKRMKRADEHACQILPIPPSTKQ